ncbi:hypothetical protein [Amphritea sp.]|uniref:hypothetical protein n=1 Tax=Amphritea sp. TaxID=1872502 RepID=UPI0025B8EDCB|nr:hypothetical protein [Amphritea sp.]
MSEENRPASDKSRSNSLGTILLVGGLTSVFTLLFWLILFQYLSAPTFLEYTGLSESYILKDPAYVNGPWVNFAIREMLESGTLISLDDLWSFQSSFYQTLITFLIAINGLIGILAFFVIKGASAEKAEESAEKVTGLYFGSTGFEERIKDGFSDGVAAAQSDYNSTVNELDNLIAEMQGYKAHIDRMSKEQVLLKRHLRIISAKISQEDKRDEDGADLILEIGKN